MNKLKIEWSGEANTAAHHCRIDGKMSVYPKTKEIHKGTLSAAQAAKLYREAQFQDDELKKYESPMIAMITSTGPQVVAINGWRLF